MNEVKKWELKLNGNLSPNIWFEYKIESKETVVLYVYLVR